MIHRISSVGRFAGIAMLIGIALLIAGCAHSPSVGPERWVRFGSEPVGFASEELWVIALPETAGASPWPSHFPRSGQLFAGAAEQEQPLPLKELRAKAVLNGCLATVELEQRFENPARSRFSGEYVLPLAGDTMVSEFVMDIGPRRIRGVVRERAEAERLYHEAAGKGYLASLLLAESPALFRLKIGNLEPGREIGVRLKYHQTLPYGDGWQQFTFPMAGEIAPESSPPSREPKISLQVEVNADVNSEEVVCDTHKIIKQSSGPGRISVSLTPERPIPKNDLMLRYRTAGEAPAAKLLVQREGAGGYFTLIAYPPAEFARQQRAPVELCLVVDDSTWMAGQTLSPAKAVVRAALHALQPEDSFTIVKMSGQQSPLAVAPIAAIPDNIRKGLDQLEAFSATEPDPAFAGLEAALKFPSDPKRKRLICCVGKGRNGWDTGLLRDVHANPNGARVYWVGLGESANRPLLGTAARIGNGAVTFIGPRDDAEKAMTSFMDRICHPALCDIHMDWNGLQVSGMFPETIPDLIVGRPILLTGRFSGAPPSEVRLTGKAGPGAVAISIPAKVTKTDVRDNAPAIFWAAAKIRSLVDQSIFEPGGDFTEAIRRVALDFGLVSPFTAHVAVDATRTTAAERPPIIGQQTNAKEK